MSVVLNTPDGGSLNTFSSNGQFGSGTETNASLFSRFDPSPDANQVAAAPGLKQPSTFGDQGSVSDTGVHTIAPAGSTSLGYADLRNIKAPRSPRSGGGGSGGSSSGAAAPKLLPNDVDSIGSSPAKSPFDKSSDDKRTTTPGQGGTPGTACTTPNPPPPLPPPPGGASASPDLNSQQFGGVTGSGMADAGMADTSTGPPNPSAGNNIPAPPNGGSNNTEDA